MSNPTALPWSEPAIRIYQALALRHKLDRSARAQLKATAVHIARETADQRVYTDHLLAAWDIMRILQETER